MWILTSTSVCVCVNALGWAKRSKPRCKVSLGERNTVSTYPSGDFQWTQSRRPDPSASSSSSTARWHWQTPSWQSASPKFDDPLTRDKRRWNEKENKRVWLFFSFYTNNAICFSYSFALNFSVTHLYSEWMHVVCLRRVFFWQIKYYDKLTFKMIRFYIKDIILFLSRVVRSNVSWR